MIGIISYFISHVSRTDHREDGHEKLVHFLPTRQWQRQVPVCGGQNQEFTELSLITM